MDNFSVNTEENRGFRTQIFYKRSLNTVEERAEACGHIAVPEYWRKLNLEQYYDPEIAILWPCELAVAWKEH